MSLRQILKHVFSRLYQGTGKKSSSFSLHFVFFLSSLACSLNAIKTHNPNDLLFSTRNTKLFKLSKYLEKFRFMADGFQNEESFVVFRRKGGRGRKGKVSQQDSPLSIRQKPLKLMYCLQVCLKFLSSRRNLERSLPLRYLHKS